MKAFWLVVLLIVLTAVGYTGYKVYEKKIAEENIQSRSVVAIPVSVVAPDHENLRDVRRFTGTLAPWSSYEVAPKVGGRLNALHAELGQKIRPGDLLAEIDDVEYIQLRTQAAVELAVNYEQLKQAKYDIELKEKDFNRISELRKKQIMSEAEFDTVETALQTAKAVYAQRLAEINRSLATLDTAQLHLDDTKIVADWGRENRRAVLNVSAIKALDEEMLKTFTEFVKQQVGEKSTINITENTEKFAATITAPEVPKGTPISAETLREVLFSALTDNAPEMEFQVTIKPPEYHGAARYVGAKHVDAGTLVSANQKLLTIIEIDQLRAVISVIEQDYPMLKIGQKATLSTDAFPDRTFEATVSNISKILESNTRQAYVELTVPNERKLLKPGMFVRVEIEFDIHENAQVLPRNAVVRRSEIEGVYTFSSEGVEQNGTHLLGIATFVPVVTGIVSDDNIEIVSPELPNEIITLGNHQLADGVLVMDSARKMAPEEKDAAEQPSN